MGQSEIHVAEFSIAANAPVGVVFETYLAAERWPQLFAPIVHTEYVERGEDRDVIAIWALQGEDAIRHWRSRRTVDRVGMRVSFTNDTVVAPLAEAGGEWSFVAMPDGTAKIVSRHEFSLVEDSKVPPERIVQELEKHTTRQLAELAYAAEHAEELAELIVDFEDPLSSGGAVEDAWKMLYEADKWPERLAHVAALTMTEDVPNFQFFDMDTTTSDGRAHTTRSVRVCLPHRKIVYKQILTPPLLAVHTGHWAFEQTGDGLVLGARHTVTIRPENLSLLGEGTTVADARDYLRRVLSANSMTNLRLAKSYAEERAGA